MAAVNPQTAAQSSQQQPGQMMGNAPQQQAQFNQFGCFQVGHKNSKEIIFNRTFG